MTTSVQFGHRTRRRALRVGLVLTLAAAASSVGIADATAAPSLATAAPSYPIVATIPGSAQDIAVDSTDHSVYAADLPSGSVTRIDGTRKVVSGAVPIGDDPYQIAVDPSAGTAYVSGATSGVVTVIDTATRTVRARISGLSPDAVAVDPGMHSVLATDIIDQDVAVIDERTNTVTASVPVGGGPFHLAVDPVSHTAFVANLYDGTVSVIDERTDRVTATVAGVDRPRAIAVDATRHRVYVSTGSAVDVIDEATDRIVATVPDPGNGADIAVDPGLHRVYVGNIAENGAGSLVVINARTNTIMATRPVGRYPESIAVDTVTHTVYVMLLRAIAVIQPSDTQAITFSSAPPTDAAVGDTYSISATGGRSGNPVTFGIDPASSAGACTAAGTGPSAASVSFAGPGTCVIDADQAGGGGLGPAAQISQTIVVDASPTISGKPPRGTVDTPYLFGFVTGGGTPSVSETGTLPSGLVLSGDGYLSGTPIRSGSFPITVTQTDRQGSASEKVTLEIGVGPFGYVVPIAGYRQTAVVGTPFAHPVIVSARDVEGNPFPGLPIRFSIASGSATFAGGYGQAVATSGSGGRATAPPLIAGPTPGPVTIIAGYGSSGDGSPAVIDETVVAAPADLQLALSTASSVRRGSRRAPTAVSRCDVLQGSEQGSSASAAGSRLGESNPGQPHYE